MGRNTKAELVQKQQEELDELSSGGILYEVTQAVLERTWKVVQEQVGVGSALQGLKTKVWRSRNATQQCSSCGIYVSDKGVHGAYRCRGARNTTSKFTGQCCNCRFSVDVTNKAENQISVQHSASLQRAGLSWGGYRRAIRTPQHATRQSSRHLGNPFLDNKHNGWARSSEQIQ